MNQRSCINHPDRFCECEKFTLAAQKKNNRICKSSIQTLFWVQNQDKAWALHLCCKNFSTGLTQWLNGKRKGMTFAVPIIWR